MESPWPSCWRMSTRGSMTDRRTIGIYRTSSSSNAGHDNACNLLTDAGINPFGSLSDSQTAYSTSKRHIICLERTRHFLCTYKEYFSWLHLLLMSYISLSYWIEGTERKCSFFSFKSKFNLKTEFSLKCHIKSDNFNNRQNWSTTFTNSATKVRCFNKHPTKMEIDKEIKSWSLEHYSKPEAVWLIYPS